MGEAQRKRGPPQSKEKQKMTDEEYEAYQARLAILQSGKELVDDWQELLELGSAAARYC